MLDWTMVDNTWLNQCVSEHFFITVIWKQEDTRL